VHAYSANVSEPVIATVKIFINGGLAYEDAREMPNGNDFWEAAEVEWSGGAAIIYPVNEYEADWACFDF
jgi:hypothetical protein